MVETRNDKRLVCPCGGLTFFANKTEARLYDKSEWRDIIVYECSDCGDSNPEWKSREDVE